MSIFDYYSLSLFLGGVVAIASGAIVFFSRDPGRVRMPWMYLNLSTAVWSFGYYMMITSPSKEIAWFSNVVLHIGAVLIPVLYFYFVAALIEVESFVKKLKPLFTVLTVGFVALCPTEVFVRDVIPKDPFPFAPDAGPLYIFFTIYFFAITVSAGLMLLYKIFISDKEASVRLLYVFLSSFAGFVGGGSVFFLTFNIPLPPYPIVFFTFYPLIITYAILRHRLFSIKVITTEIVTFAIWIVLLFRMLLATEQQEQIIDLSILLCTLVLGIFLIRSVYREVEQRERIEVLATELERANNQQESLIHFISHEVKGYLTKAQAAFAGLTQGDYGSLSPQVKSLARVGLEDMRKGSQTVMDILSAANLKKGTIQYKMQPFNLADTVLNVSRRLESNAIERRLLLHTVIEGDAREYMLKGDEGQIAEHVVRNLIDNAIRYTLKGLITVSLSKRDRTIVFSVKDSGVGITPEDKVRLFTEGGKGKDSIKVNVHSTGYGLFIAKTVVDAHGGVIRAESEGAGKGSTFIVELPGV